MPDEATLIPGSSFWNDIGKLNSWHDLPSIRPSCPKINTALTTYYSLKTNVSFAAGGSPSVSAKANGSFEPTPEVSDSCCARSQREKCCVSVESGAAARRKNRSFMQTAASISGRIHRLPDKSDLCNCGYCKCSKNCVRGIFHLVMQHS